MGMAVKENEKQNNDDGTWSLLEVLKRGCLSFLGGQEECRRRGNSSVYSCNFPDPVEDRPSCVEYRIESLVFWSY